MVAGGCNTEQASETLKDVEQSAEQAAEGIQQGVGEAVAEGEKAVDALTEQATAYLTPLREQFGKLEGLKDSPEELKKAVADLIQSIEDKAADIQLPEAVNTALAGLKEKLLALKASLEGEIDQAKIGQHIQEIMESVKSELGIQQN
jgi:chromosome segregation ATPase